MNKKGSEILPKIEGVVTRFIYGLTFLPFFDLFKEAFL